MTRMTYFVPTHYSKTLRVQTLSTTGHLVASPLVLLGGSLEQDEERQVTGHAGEAQSRNDSETHEVLGC